MDLNPMPLAKRFRRSARYHPEWLKANGMGGSACRAVARGMVGLGHDGLR